MFRRGSFPRLARSCGAVVMLHAGCWPRKHNDRGRASGRVRRRRSAIRRTGTAGCARRFAEVLVPSWSFHPNWQAWVRCNNVMVIRQRRKIKLRLQIPRIGIGDRPRRRRGQLLPFDGTVSDYSSSWIVWLQPGLAISQIDAVLRCSHSDQWNWRRRSTSRIRRSRSTMSVACDRKRSTAIACQRSERRAYRLKSIGNNLRRAADRRSPSDSRRQRCGFGGVAGLGGRRGFRRLRWKLNRRRAGWNLDDGSRPARQKSGRPKQEARENGHG